MEAITAKEVRYAKDRLIGGSSYVYGDAGDGWFRVTQLRRKRDGSVEGKKLSSGKWVGLTALEVQ